MRILLTTAAIVAIICGNAQAQAYRWVDKDGKVHYTQTPPPPEAKNVQKKAIGSGAGSPGGTPSNLPFATQQAAKNFPVTLYTTPDCGPPCDSARSTLVKRTVPFKEISVVDQKGIDDLKKVGGKVQVPLFVVGSQTQSGWQEDALKSLLDSAGYPSSGPAVPLESLRKMDPQAAEVAPAPAPATAPAPNPAAK